MTARRGGPEVVGAAAHAEAEPEGQGPGGAEHAEQQRHDVEAGQTADGHALVGAGRDQADDDQVDDEDERQQGPGHDHIGDAVHQVVAGHVEQGPHAHVFSFSSSRSSMARPAAWTIICCSDKASRLRWSSRARA